MYLSSKFKTAVTVSVLFNFNFLFCQVGIGTTTPDPSSVLDIKSTNKGVLLPGIAVTSLTDHLTIASPANGLLIWNNGLGGLADTGLYYWNNQKWNKISTTTNTSTVATGTSGNAWNNSATNGGNNTGGNTNLSLGTNTYDDLIFKVNSVKSGRLGTDNSISLGTGANAGQNGIAIGMSGSAYQGVSIGNEASVTANDGLQCHRL